MSESKIKVESSVTISKQSSHGDDQLNKAKSSSQDSDGKLTRKHSNARNRSNTNIFLRAKSLLNGSVKKKSTLKNQSMLTALQ